MCKRDRFNLQVQNLVVKPTALQNCFILLTKITRPRDQFLSYATETTKVLTKTDTGAKEPRTRPQKIGLETY